MPEQLLAPSGLSALAGLAAEQHRGAFGGTDGRAVMDALQGYVWIADADGKLSFLSRMPVGLNIHQFIGSPVLALIASEHRDVADQAIKRILSGESAIQIEVRGAFTSRWYRLQIVGIRNRGNVTGFAVHALDVDDAKRTEAEAVVLRARVREQLDSPASWPSESDRTVQRRFDLMADALPMLISYVDKERRYQYNNAAYERWFESSRGQLRGLTMGEVLGTQAYEEIRSYVDAVLAGNTVSFETTVPYRRTAGLRRVLARYVPDVTSNGEVQGFYVLVEDITLRRETESALREREEELRQLQKMEALGQLASGMAHEFNNLLQTILNNCGAAIAGIKDPGIVEQIERIERTAERGASLTQQLLSFSRGTELRPGPIDINGLIEDMKILLDRLVGARISVTSKLAAHGKIHADPGQLQQVLMNLVINARDAMPDGGRLAIETKMVRLDDSRHRAGEYLLLQVSDTGAGMDDNTLKRIFDPFFTTKPAGQGTGLGLSTVYGIVGQCGGHIEVDSSPGRGTCFRLYFPS